MKNLNQKIAKMVFIFFGIIIGINAYSQGDYVSLGENKGFNPRWIFRVEVRDSETHAPIKNAFITLGEEGSGGRICSIETNRQGVGIIIIRETGRIPGSGILKVVHKNYSPWKEEIDQWDFFQEEDGKQFILREMPEYGWTQQDQISERKIVRDLSNDRYKMLDEINNTYLQGSPALFEFEVMMEETGKKIDINN